ncbi:hypothetical protein Nepgr_022752 [Nepenthes gracilis]|uniref:Pectinesterase inhibitor domain-containing protein n=1 Tax=Nepenthes gracilis TaxID=150966 RepID=A0AAD3XYG1_NEPGR|nr:hypothetical protein Nepgr_022752 [Nepenthes gracilis]
MMESNRQFLFVICLASLLLSVQSRTFSIHQRLSNSEPSSSPTPNLHDLELSDSKLPSPFPTVDIQSSSDAFSPENDASDAAFAPSTTTATTSYSPSSAMLFVSNTPLSPSPTAVEYSSVPLPPEVDGASQPGFAPSTTTSSSSSSPSPTPFPNLDRELSSPEPSPSPNAFEYSSVSLPPEDDASKAASAPLTAAPAASDVPFASLTSLLSIPDDAISEPAPPQVVEACEKTDYPLECRASLLSSRLHGDLGIDGSDLGPATILGSSVQTFSHALEIIKSEISSKSSMLKADQSTINTCKDMYDNAIDELNGAMQAASSGDKYGANIRFSAALTSIETCEDGLKDNVRGDSSSSPLASANKILSKLASNSLALGNFALGLGDHVF